VYRVEQLARVQYILQINMRKLGIRIKKISKTYCNIRRFHVLCISNIFLKERTSFYLREIKLNLILEFKQVLENKSSLRCLNISLIFVPAFNTLDPLFKFHVLAAHILFSLAPAILFFFKTKETLPLFFPLNAQIIKWTKQEPASSQVRL